MLHGRRREPSRRLQGLTLVEVVAALVILGILLALIVKASTQSSRQLALAERRLYAAREADRLIAGWFSASAPLQPGLSGQIAGTPALYWETVDRDGGRQPRLGTRVVQLRMFTVASTAAPGPVPDRRDGVPLVTVDLMASVMPPPEPPPEDQQAAPRPSPQDDREDPRLRLPPASAGLR
jgi:prepilin-type N-terminal cleavage/methylation domain-containing protein